VGYATLELLLKREVTIAGVFTHPPDPHEKAWSRSVPGLAEARGLEIFMPESFKDPVWVERIAGLRPDLMLSMYYRKIIPEPLLNLAPLGAYNMHGSYLPGYRGRAPLNWAILNGESHTGVSLHVMVKEPDAGDLVDQEKVPIEPDEPVSALLDRVRDAAVRVLDRQLEALLAGRAPRHPQDHSKATYFGKRTPEDGRVDWSRSAREVYNLVRAVTHPFPGAFTDVSRAGPVSRLLIWWGRPVETPDAPTAAAGTVLSLDPLTIACGKGAFAVTESEWVTATRPVKPAPAAPLRVGDRIGMI
jgi:methionyl-tRNA formyltransferase